MLKNRIKVLKLSNLVAKYKVDAQNVAFPRIECLITFYGYDY